VNDAGNDVVEYTLLANGIDDSGNGRGLGAVLTGIVAVPELFSMALLRLGGLALFFCAAAGNWTSFDQVFNHTHFPLQGVGFDSSAKRAICLTRPFISSWVFGANFAKFPSSSKAFASLSI
jgi:hypothetical protein